ncbi:hypothetical protein [Brevibacillus brevis]|uniref:hypothetical protein n=1 Tax=Brevibacillus brevis TaxID=1393 RepID=UPI00165E4348|nr:hypothetical protein [Brevibacillus brevis]
MNTNQANVTVLTDANGVQREYTEVKRKADVGERIKIVADAMYHGLKIGTVYIAEIKEECVYVDGWWLEDGVDCDYVVLAPSSTVIIDGKRYREEKRKAAVGERILITGEHAGDHTGSGNGVPIGASYTVSRVDYDGDVWHVKERRYSGLIYDSEYVVLTQIDEPVTQQNEAAPKSITVTIPAIHVTVASMDDAVKAVADAVKAELQKHGGPKFNPEKTVRKLADLPRMKSAQEIRDEVVERAKADVATLKRGEYYKVSDGTEFPFSCDAEFIVNREKRTVVCLLRGHNSGKVRAKGIAKCAPDDVFNTHIGRTIALRRALGLDVPTEYTSAPQPESINAQVGDVVLFHGTKNDINEVVTLTKRAPELDNSDGNYFGQKAFRHTGGYGGWIADKQFKILDDSREEVSA